MVSRRSSDRSVVVDENRAHIGSEHSDLLCGWVFWFSRFPHLIASVDVHIVAWL